MKKTQRTEALRNIRRNLVSFLSIAIISMLAVTAYLGVSFSAEGLRKSADATYEAENFADIEIAASALLGQADLDAVRAVEGVTDAEGIVSIPSRVRSENGYVDITVRSISERISMPHMQEGRLPRAEDECAVEKTLARKMGYRIGDQVSLAARDTMTDMAIRKKSYTVTGVFTIADHLSEMISFDPMVLVTRGAFNPMLLGQDRYTGILVQAGYSEPYRFRSARSETTDGIAGRLEERDSRWIVTGLHKTAGYICVDEDARMLDTVSVTFSMLFVVIAAMVIYATISRLVENDSRLTGAEKAMGLKNSEIFAKYVLFGVGGTAAGAAAGIMIAYFAFERFVLYCFGSVFLLGEQETAFKELPAIIVTAGAAALSLTAVFAACRRLLKSTAVSLMTGQNAAARRKAKASSGSGALYIRLMFRNMRTDWKRVLVSIASIAGCCMLLMIGFSLKYAVSRVPDRQYGDIQHFSLEISADPSAIADSGSGIRAVLEEEGIAYTAAYTAEIPYRAGDEPGLLTLICTDHPEEFSDYYRLADAKTGKELAVPESGVLVTGRFADQYGLDTGSRFRLYDGSMNAHEAEVAGIIENYIGVLTICSRAYAEECLGQKLPENILLVRGGVRDPEALRQRLSGEKGFISLSSARKQEAMLNGMSLMLNLVVLLLGLLALMIACFILLNLVSTYVSQKKNELTIMRINGYTTGETIRYASMECYGITALGILAGLAGGQLFGTYLLRKIDQLAMCFVRDPVWISFAASAAITAAISAVIHFLAFRKIRGLKLSDIQK